MVSPKARRASFARTCTRTAALMVHPFVNGPSWIGPDRDVVRVGNGPAPVIACATNRLSVFAQTTCRVQPVFPTLHRIITTQCASRPWWQGTGALPLVSTSLQLRKSGLLDQSSGQFALAKALFVEGSDSGQLAGRARDAIADDTTQPMAHGSRLQKWIKRLAIKAFRESMESDSCNMSAMPEYGTPIAFIRRARANFW